MKRLIYILLIAFTAILNCSDLSGMPRGSLSPQISRTGLLNGVYKIYPWLKKQKF